MNWSPTRIGSLLDDVQILHDGARGVLVIPIRGESEAVVSQDQKAIVLSGSEVSRVIDGEDVTQQGQGGGSGVLNASSALDGLKITSFSSSRAIVNGPGGSRLIYDNEEVMLGGVAWNADIQDNGIEFSNGIDRVLLLFDRSLSSLNRIAGQSQSVSSSSSAAIARIRTINI